MSRARRLALILAVSAGGVFLDQVAKAVAQFYLPTSGEWSFLGDTVRLQLAHNQGAFLSVGAYLPDFWRYLFFNVGVVILLLGMLGYALFSRQIHPAGVFAAALLIAGGVSNLADRLAYNGSVVDFINFGIGPVRTGILNLADIFITSGGILFFVNELRRRNNEA